MEKQLVYKGENPPQVDGIDWTVLKGHAVSQPLALDAVVNLPSQNSFFWRLHAEECGGGWTNTGRATIICSPKGEALKPYRIPRSGPLACGEHAFFVGASFVKIRVSHHRRDFDIGVWLFAINPDTGSVLARELWKASLPEENVLESIPNKLSKYVEAIKAAVAKATCYHCREPHFIKEGGNNK